MLVAPGPLSAGAQALAPTSTSVPDCTVVVPVYVLLPLRVTVFVPALINPPVPVTATGIEISPLPAMVLVELSATLVTTGVPSVVPVAPVAELIVAVAVV